MKKKTKRALTALTGASMILSAATAQAEEIETSIHQELSVTEGTAAEFTKLANVEGAFAFNQTRVTPPDEAFNLFGTVVTGACAKPAFAVDTDEANYFINVGGKVKQAYTINVREMDDAQKNTIGLCSCATGPASANLQITGVRLEDVLSLAQIDEYVNTVTVRGADGYAVSLPLSYALSNKAMIVYQVGGQDMPYGTQFWVPSTVAKYFTRNVVDIELSVSEQEVEVETRADELKAEVAIMNYTDGAIFTSGQEITFEGYADDLGSPITAVEFSMDGGETWTAYETQDATADKWVYWNYTITAGDAGDYQLAVRARTANGTVSPLSAKLNFSVAQ